MPWNDSFRVARASQLGTIASSVQPSANPNVVHAYICKSSTTNPPCLRKVKGGILTRKTAASTQEVDEHGPYDIDVKGGLQQAPESTSPQTTPLDLVPTLRDIDIDRMSTAFAMSKVVQIGVGAKVLDPQKQLQCSESHSSLTGLSLADVFSSLCICDPKIMGNPVKMHSRGFSLGPRGLKVGSCKFLNLPYGASEGRTLTMQAGTDNRPQFLLEIAAPLVDHETGHTAYILASQIDVTEAVRKSSVLESRYAYCMANLGRHGKSEVSHTVPVVNGDLSKAFIGAVNEMETSTEIDWLDFAASLEKCQSNFESDIRPFHPDHYLEPTSMKSPHLRSFFRFIDRLRPFYTSFFALSPAASSAGSQSTLDCYNVLYASPKLVSAGADLKVNISKTEPEVLRHLSKELSRGQPVIVNVRWGTKEVPRRLYCSPMVEDTARTQRIVWWLCFLIDGTSD